MLLTSLCLTFIVFFLTNLQPNLEKLAKNQGNFRMTDDQVISWLEDRSYLDPLPVKYGRWLGVVPGWTFEGNGDFMIAYQVGKRLVTPDIKSEYERFEHLCER